MTNATLKTKILSLVLMLTMLVGMMPITGIVSFATELTELTPETTNVVSLAVGETVEYYDNFNDAWTAADEAEGEATPHSECLSYDGFAPNGENHLEACLICGKTNGVTHEHNYTDEVYCSGTLCADCGGVYGERSDVHLDENDDLVCDLCGEKIIYAETDGNLTVDVSTSSGDKFLIKLTVSEEARYAFYSNATTGDPKAYLYDADMNEMDYSDDSNEKHGKYNFYINKVLEPGVYYLVVSPYSNNFEAQVIIEKICLEHVDSGEKFCTGTLCSVCGFYYGEADADNHKLIDEAYCIGTKCELCKEYVGEGDENNHVDVDSDYSCDLCNIPYVDVYAEATDKLSVFVEAYDDERFIFKLTVTRDAAYKIYSVKQFGDPRAFLYNANMNEIAYSDDEGGGLDFLIEIDLQAGVYYLKVQPVGYEMGATIKVVPECIEHQLTDKVTCSGTLCSACGLYVGEGNDAHEFNGEQYCTGYFCTICNEFVGDGNDNHMLTGSATCIGYYCNLCNGYFGEADEDAHYFAYSLCSGDFCYYCEMLYGESNDHVDEDDDHICDVCEIDLPTIYAGITAGSSLPTEVQLGKYIYIEFIPDETGVYRFWSDCNGDLFAYVYNVVMWSFAHDNDSGEGLNFSLDVSLKAGQPYYFVVSNQDINNASGNVYLKKLCDEHTFVGEATCVGTLCSVCGEYAGEAIDHDSLIFDYDSIEHFTNCSMCLEYNDNFERHEYNEDGVCVCGRQRMSGIYIGDLLLTDGQYLDNNGNVGMTKPDGGYAHYDDGILTLNNFSFVFDGEYPEEARGMIYSETDLHIVVEGVNYVETSGDDTIYVANADLTVSGNGVITIRSERASDSVGDGIDVNGGDLTINGGTFFIYSSDNGIEVEGDTEINGGIFYMDVEDDGIEADELIINYGVFHIDSDDDDCIEASSLVINGGDFHIESDDECGFDVLGDLIINGGNFHIKAYSTGIYTDGDAWINGGSFIIDAYGEYPALSAYGDIIFGKKMGQQNTSYHEDYETVWVDENGEIIYYAHLNSQDDDSKTVISEDWISANTKLYYTGENQIPEIEVYNYYTDTSLVLGVDYEIRSIYEETKEAGVYAVVISGIGDYTGNVIVTYTIHEEYELSLNSELEVEISGMDDEVYSFIKFVPNVSATYRFVFSTANHLIVDVYNGDEYIEYHESEDGYIVIELELEAGVTYRFDVYDRGMDSVCNISAKLICNDHRGGHATYHELAVCQLCGESYGELLQCPGHFGGEATYHDHAVCEECGYEYGELLVCDHMCHKGGYYTIIWHIFERIYEFLGIEEECKCGDEHY